MASIDDIFDFVADEIGVDRTTLNPSTDINDELGVEGDDFSELIERYSDRFQVDMNGYLWYFHHAEEGFNIGGLFFRPPYDRVARVPVTPELLLEGANGGRWPLEYVGHKLPKKRWDLLVNQLLLVVIVLVAVLIGLREFDA